MDRKCESCRDEIPADWDERDNTRNGEDLCEDCWMEKYNRYDDGEAVAERRQMGLCNF